MIGEWAPILLYTLLVWSYTKHFVCYCLWFLKHESLLSKIHKHSMTQLTTPTPIDFGFLSSQFYFFFFDFWELCDEALESFSLSLAGSGLAFCQSSGLRLNIGQGGKVSWKVLKKRRKKMKYKAKEKQRGCQNARLIQWSSSKHIPNQC